MKIFANLTAAVLVAIMIQVQKGDAQNVEPSPEQTQQEQLVANWLPKVIPHSEVKAFAEPTPVTVSEKAAVKFKPQIKILSGCVPYPAVNEIGETSGGLQETGGEKSGCRGSGHGSQVYGRSTWYNGAWAIMYSWYFPKDSPSMGLGHRHDWEHIVIYINNPDLASPTLLGCSASYHSGYKKYAPCPPWATSGTSVKVKYVDSWPLNHAVDVTSEEGTFQPLIMWEQMPLVARKALDDTKFGAANVPMNKWHFFSNVKQAWPFAGSMA